MMVAAALMDPIDDSPCALIAEVAAERSKKPMYSIEPVIVVIVVGRVMVLRVRSLGAGMS